jgi:hypothetical protein
VRKYWEHQVDDLRCPHKNIIHLDGRSVGKSIVLSSAFAPPYWLCWMMRS